jgi:hypothetical protein
MSLLQFFRGHFSPVVFSLRRSFTTSSIPRGIEEFFDTKLKEGERRTSGVYIYNYLFASSLPDLVCLYWQLLE